MKERYDLINYIIKQIGATSYLEIGVQSGKNIAEIVCDNKLGVDPDTTSAADIFMTSDDFFKSNKQKYDCIFIDGLHEADQVERDILNSLDCLTEKGIIICHDMKPKSYEQQAVPRISKSWTGDCWKAWVRLRSKRYDLDMFVVDLCTGCGVVVPNTPQSYQFKYKSKLTYSNLKSNESEWLSVVDVMYAERYFQNMKRQDKSVQGTVSFPD